MFGIIRLVVKCGVKWYQICPVWMRFGEEASITAKPFPNDGQVRCKSSFLVKMWWILASLVSLDFPWSRKSNNLSFLPDLKPMNNHFCRDKTNLNPNKPKSKFFGFFPALPILNPYPKRWLYSSPTPFICHSKCEQFGCPLTSWRVTPSKFSGGNSRQRPSKRELRED